MDKVFDTPGVDHCTTKNGCSGVLGKSTATSTCISQWEGQRGIPTDNVPCRVWQEKILGCQGWLSQCLHDGDR